MCGMQASADGQKGQCGLVIWRADLPAERSSLSYGLLSMTDESGGRVCEVLSAYLDGAAVTPPARFTRGLRLSS